MKQTQEFDGKNIDHAVEKACSTLNVSKKNLVYDVISSGSTGIFGIVGVRKARIRVTLPEKNADNGTASGASDYDSDMAGVMSIVDEAFGKGDVKPAKKDTNKVPLKDDQAEDTDPKPEQTGKPADNRKKGYRRKAGGGHDNRSTEGKPGVSKAKAYNKKKRPRKKVAAPRHAEVDKNGVKQEKDADKSRETAPDKHSELSSDPRLSADPQLSVDEVPAPSGTGEELGKETSDSDICSVEQSIAVETGPAEASGAVDEGDREGDAPSPDHVSVEEYDDRDEGYPPKYKGEIPVDVSEEAVRVGQETLQKMVSLITEDASVVAETDEDRLLLRVEGGNSGVLIGRRGQTLEAMQFLTDKIINRHSESRVRLKVDIEGYMEARKANLKSLAYKMADKAKKTGKPATINQMTAQDRRIVHLALKNDYRVRTQSMGDGYYRRLVIFPKKGSHKRRRNFRK